MSSVMVGALLAPLYLQGVEGSANLKVIDCLSVSKRCVAFLDLPPFRDVILADTRVDQCRLKSYFGRGLLSPIGRASQCILM